MELQDSFFIYPLRIAAVIAIMVAFSLQNNRKIKILSVIFYLLLTAGFWGLLYSIEIATSKLSLQLFFAKMEYLGICAIPPLWIYFSVLFTYPKRKQNWKMILGYFLPFIISLGIVITNDLHHWFWTQSTQTLFNGIYLLSNKYGFWFWIHTAFSYIYIVTGAILVISALVRKKKITLPAFLIVLAVLVPIFGSFFFIFKIQSPFDVTPLTISLSGVLLAVSMIQFNFFNIKPIAKSTLFSSLSDPVFFINNEHIIIEANTTAQRLFCIPDIAYLNETIEAVIQKKISVIPNINPNESIEISINDEGNTITYRINTNTVLQKKKIEGYLITLKDITAEKQIYQAKAEGILFSSYMNEINDLVVNSSDIHQLLNQVMEKVKKFLTANLIFVISENDENIQKIYLLDHRQVTLASLGIIDIANVVKKARIEKETLIITNPELLNEINGNPQNSSGILAYPLFANLKYFGTLIIILGQGSIPPRNKISLVERSLFQTMLSISRLQVLEDLEKKVIERTNQIVKLNSDLNQNYLFLDRIVDTSPNLIFCLNTLDEITFCNSKFIHEFGFTEKKAVIGQHISYVFKNGVTDLLDQILEINKNSALSGEYECILTLRSGIHKTYLLNKAISLSDDQKSHDFIYTMIDLTKQKNQEIKIKNNEQRLRTLFESVPVILLEEDQSELKVLVDKIIAEHAENSIKYFLEHPEFIQEFAKLIKITDCNQMALDFYGFSTKEELFIGYPLLISEGPSKSLQKQIENYMLGKTDFETEDLRVRSNGEQVHINLRLHIPPENVKSFSRVLVSAIDITKRKKAENDLVYSEEKFRSIIQQSVDGIILFDQKGKIIEWNRADETITGYSNFDIQRLKIWELISSLTNKKDVGSLSGIKNLLNNALFDRTSPLLNQVIEIPLTNKNGKNIIVEAILSAIEISHDFVGSIIIRDITEIKKSQAAIQKLASAVREISEGLVIANYKGETEYVNLSVEKITGYSNEELMGKNLLHFLVSDLTVEQIHIEELGLQAGNIQRGKMICSRKDGSQYTLQYNIAPINDDQGNRNYISVISDVSQSELLEQQNRQAQKLEAIGSLAAGVAHEINTPTQYVGNNLLFIKKEFGSIIQLLEKNQQLLNRAQPCESMVDLIIELHQEEKDANLNYLTAEIPRAIDESLEGIGRVTKIVQAIKEFSHPSMDEKTPVDLNRAIDTTITVSHNEWKYVADLVPHYDIKLPSVICSPGEINQVILNLITNAAHAIKDQIEKGVYSKGLIEIFTFAKENSVEIHVQDNGGGIPVGYREKVFNPFFTTKPVGMGTGQGLSIAYKVIVNKHNGSLVFDTELGKGTTFMITLPLAAGE